MLPFTLLEYIDASGRSPFGKWFASLSAPAAAKATVAITRLASGNFSNVKAVSSGVSELRINFGPGYRIYFGEDGKNLVILLGGGAKARQEKDIVKAIHRWKDYSKRKLTGAE